MILVDTSVWIDHLRSADAHLAKLLERGRVAVHDFVIGEIACGNLRNRKEILSLLSALPMSEDVTHDEALYFIERHRLMGRGIGFIDARLLAAASLNTMQLWTRDKRLASIAQELGVSYALDAD